MRNRVSSYVRSITYVVLLVKYLVSAGSGTLSFKGDLAPLVPGPEDALYDFRALCVFAGTRSCPHFADTARSGVSKRRGSAS